MFGKSEKCFSPWFGFMVIVVVCVVIAGAVFFETKDSAARRRAKKRVHKAPRSAVQTVPAPVIADTTGSAKVLF
ncbi:MAG: hypothetical protein HQL20_03670 [Candidatus Omnitrophica bacterium]|nr:hypothetical protein [Candidatus Omnitrophota bacterium]